MWLKGLILARFLQSDNELPVSESIMLQLISKSTGAHILMREICLPIWLTYILYFLRKSGETAVQKKIVFGHVTLIRSRVKFMPFKNFPKDNCHISF